MAGAAGWREMVGIAQFHPNGQGGCVAIRLRKNFSTPGANFFLRRMF
jgi:hypothetical protein